MKEIDEGCLREQRGQVTPVRERWLVKLFSPPSLDKVNHAMRSSDDKIYPSSSTVFASRLKEPTRFINESETLSK